MRDEGLRREFQASMGYIESSGQLGLFTETLSKQSIQKSEEIVFVLFFLMFSVVANPDLPMSNSSLPEEEERHPPTHTPRNDLPDGAPR